MSGNGVLGRVAGRRRSRLSVVALGCILLLGYALFAFKGEAATETPAPKKPNVLLIVLDDAGYSDIGAFGRGDAPTPAIDKLASEGVRYTRFYADSSCTPTRLSLMTGRSASEVAAPPHFRGISPEVITLPKALRNHGYSVHHVGKWHLGEIPEALPPAQGFDTWFGFDHQQHLRGPDQSGNLVRRASTYLDPWLQGSERPLRRYSGHLNDILAQYAANKIKELAQKDAPWFLNYWLYAPHVPIEPGEQYAAMEADNPSGRYRAMLRHMDASVGSVLDALEEVGQAGETIVVLFSDNGGSNAEINNNYPFHGTKMSYLEGGLRVPLVVRWPGRLPVGESNEDIVSVADIYPSILALLGLPIPAEASGRATVGGAVEKDSDRRVLINELNALGFHQYTVLSEDGRWRLFNDKLFDLENNSGIDVATQHPDITRSLKKQYFSWFRKKMLMNVKLVRDPDTGQEALIGDSLRRAPGHGAWTFAAGIVMPNNTDTGHFIARQANAWSLELLPERRLKYRLGDVEILTDSLPARDSDACVAVVISTNHARWQMLNKSMSRIALYVDGVGVAGLNREVFLEVDSDLMAHRNRVRLTEFKGSVLPDIRRDFQAPTLIGEPSFPGRIVGPLLLNAEIYPQEFNKKYWETGFPDIEEISTVVCKGS